MQHNIEEKIGVPYEIIGVDNSKNTYSIFSAYNEGVSKSRFDIVCFIHEDIHFHTNGWGLKILEHLRDPHAGIIGVCGCATLSKIPAPWSLFNPFKYIVQSSPTRRNPKLQQTGFTGNENKQEVLAVDGVFMCARKALFQKIRFDEETFSGYHSYDIDICLQARVAGYSNYSVNDILIEHYSKGFHSKDWIINSMTLSDKWSRQLPMSLNPVSAASLSKMEYKYMTVNFAKYMIRAGYSNAECTRTIAKYLQHHDGSQQRAFIRKIAFKVFLVRLNKRPLSFFQA